MGDQADREARLILGLRWPLIGAAVGACLVLSLAMLSRGSTTELALFLPIPLISLVLMSLSAVHALRKRRIIALYDNGAGEAPIVPHLLGRRRTRGFLIGQTRTEYDPPYLRFDPPLVVEGDQPLEKLFVDARFTGGGIGRIAAFVQFANGLAGHQPEEEE